MTGLVAFMVALAFLQVLLRQVGQLTGAPLSLLWGDTLLRHLVLWVGFAGAALAASSDRQFAMDVAAHLLSGRRKALAALLCHGFALAVCALLARASWAFLAEERSHPAILFTALGRDVPAWWLEAAAPLGFAVLAFHYALKLADAAASALRPEANGA